MTTEQSAPATPRAPGRLGDPAMSLRDDPRADPRMLAALAPLGLDGRPEPSPVTIDSPRDQLLAFCGAAEEAFQGLFGVFATGLDPVPGVSTRTETIPGPDGNEITLFIHRPTDAPEGPLPCLVHLHGGGMVLLRAEDAAYGRWRDSLAAQGLVVVGVEFRNGAGQLGPHPYPAGLEDCVTATLWALDNLGDLGGGPLLISGESGGGNLTLGVTLRAKREGWLDRIAGVYALCPYISGAYADPPADLVSLRENASYFLGEDLMGILVEAYDPGGAHAADPGCWPWRAAAEDLAGLPPHVISVNELDPLRDEGLAYLRRLQSAGVSAAGRIVPGTCHGADVLMPAAMPDVYASTVRDIAGFAHSL
jgi:acetyl esterase